MDPQGILMLRNHRVANCILVTHGQPLQANTLDRAGSNFHRRFQRVQYASDVSLIATGADLVEDQRGAKLAILICRMKSLFLGEFFLNQFETSI